MKEVIEYGGQRRALRPALREEDFLRAQLRVHAERVNRARRRIEQALVECARWAVSFSGGKDSLVVLHLVREIAPDTPAIFVDSGAEFPETLDLIARTPNVYVVHPRMTILQMYRELGDYGYKAPPRQMRKGEIKDMFTREPITRAVRELGVCGTLDGMRGDESSARRKMMLARPQPWRSADGHLRCEPIWDWETADVWAYIAAHGLDYNACYDVLSRLGVPRELWRVAPYAGARMNQFGRWAILKRGWPELWERFAHEFPRVRTLS